ncbi:MAG: heparinase II/III family protein [Fibrobacteria bacterium]|nr:heparinase II/III family protein [Fibrobacteria bacterium]
MLINQKVRFSIVTTLLLLLTMTQSFAKAWQDIKTIQDLWPDYGSRIETLLNNLDLTKPGLEPVKATYEDGKLYAAGKQLLDYYKTGTSGSWLRKDSVTPGTKTNATADEILNDIVTIQGLTAKVPRLGDGGLDWNWKGPDNSMEWAWIYNRHYQISHLYDAYRSTGNPSYASKLDESLRDFLLHCPPYPGAVGNGAIWRGLEIAARVSVWSNIFYGLINDEGLSPATRLLMLVTLYEHAHYLRNFHGDGNWVTMELRALLLLTAVWPEFKSAPAWQNYSLTTLTAELKMQVYPDGVQTELTSMYHNVAADMFESTYDICRKANIDVSPEFSTVLEHMWNFLAYSMRPDGYGLLNNDADKDYNRNKIATLANTYERSDWAYIAHNGLSGEIPPVGPSTFFEWAGHFVMRNGWDINAHWSIFDKGPWGTAHQHNDHLHLSVAAYGRDLLVDGGRFAYGGDMGEKFGTYARSSMSHNVILIDGKNQAAGPLKATSANTNYKIGDVFDYTSGEIGSFDGISGTASHRRSVTYLRDKYWIVMDRINSDRARTIQVLWHFNPDCNVIVDGKSVVSNDDGKGNLRIVPIGNVNWTVQMVKGQESPSIQGWYSPTYNTAEKNFTAIYSGTVNPGTHFAWLLVPGHGSVPAPVVDVKELGSNLKMIVSHNGEHTLVETAINTLPTEKREDLALLRPASFSSEHSSTLYGGTRGNDGDIQTEWVSAQSDVDLNPYYQIDLGSDYIIERIEIVDRQSADRPASRTNFQVWGSEDEDFTQYSVLGTKTDEAYAYKGTWSIDIAEEKVSRHIRVQRINDAGLFMFGELRVYGRQKFGKNLAVLKPVTYSSVHSTPYAGKRANDDNITTEWASPSGSVDLNPWYQIDLGSDYIIERVEVVARQSADQPTTRTNFEVWGSRDDAFVAYSLLGSKTDSAYAHKGTWSANIKEELVSKYIRVQRINNAGHFSFAEIRVFGKLKYPGNLALHKSVSASGVWATPWYNSENANDDNIETEWISGKSGDSIPYIQVDLGKDYVIGRLELVARQNVDQPATRTNFAFWGSQDSTFSEYTVLVSKNDSAYPHAGTWSTPVLVKNVSRYVRVQRINVPGTLAFAEFRIFGEEYIPVVVKNKLERSIGNQYSMYQDLAAQKLIFNGLTGYRVIDIYNMRGEKLISSTDRILNISRLSKGTYLVNVSGSNYPARKFMKWR